ncbi:erythroblast NAD(P)(+)--arginine ADP-ribosyltransferase-like [Hemiscyllium ocellatum]|uniref:erythroblast NAD(P)(+)--arginine ADP-ribosyltransferase-like n=1 Tax=Hemiscyllium ocellatum TaxID=170820 RepID=UPI002967736F|nr:erythroblast NAD(P)(+)--arginine ADP-ribosyltransferase-like [Hemiscyllium ocellatum]XP_060709446.1 erythroblast NAD(P)(+)--arginine ADP-ribosyltransferase-like [Hemiscyllium ocellatum]XP_060709447.1 erythroblast NAD(P)(+)--arginine ADP-ribosyltransferase-like [Hemiscyllium ocellatum]XP_060709448.1 erythroblast NAD(P)(+)--arginine ADP-ribosyltransferase-like [Hemiscyllium ocellatum]XP_060709449.1 erythroblast NAD(P)(+)--arginine ADP-ribosyltransferase-like [Hemiscyllium ocellatum]XP_0607094
MMRMQLLGQILLLSLCLENQRTSALKAPGKWINLDMAKNSAAYIFTQEETTDQAAIDYIRKEWQDQRDFLQVWELANRSLGHNCIIPPGLRREHLIAINAYTQESSLYKEFNAATRKYGASDAIYQTKFHFKSFHYLLSVALAKFQQKQRITFRGVRILFNATKGEEVRLGQFSSTSLMRSIAISFMNRLSDANTLFEIRTKLGVFISEFSTMKSEEEVLIPPTEVFEVEDTPLWEKQGSKKWIKIKLASRGSKGIRVTVDTCNGAFKVSRRKSNCSKLGQRLRGRKPSWLSNKKLIAN